MFTRMLEHARRRPNDFTVLARDLFGAMATGGRVGFEEVAWFDGGLFDDDTALPLKKSEIEMTLKASALDWSEIDPSILGTLFERGLDPDKRSQLGAHYTDHDKIMLIVEPVVVRPWLDEWTASRPRSPALWIRRKVPSRRARGQRNAGGQIGCCATSSTGCAASPSSIRPADPATSSISPYAPSRTSSTAFSSKPRLWAPPGISHHRPGQRQGNRDQPLRRRTGPRVRLDRRNPVDAPQRLYRLS